MNYFENIVEEIMLVIFNMCDLDTQYNLVFVSQKCRKIILNKITQLKDALLDPALIEIEKQNYDKALTKLDKMVRIFPDSSELWKEIAICYKQKDLLEDALEALFKSKQCGSKQEQYFIQSQIFLHIKKDGFLARDEINKAIKEDPGDVRFYHFRAYIESGLHRDEHKSSEDTEKLRDESLQRELVDYEFILTKPYKRRASIINNIGAVYFEKGDHQKALDYFDKSIKYCNYYLQAYFNQAMACKEMDNVERAISIYDTMLDINPHISRIHTLRGQCYYIKGQYKRSLEDFSRSLEGDKIELDSIIGLYRSMMKTKKLNLALPILTKINNQMRDVLLKAEDKTNTELSVLKLKPESESNSLRIEAKERTLQKQKKESIEILQLSLRFSADLYFLLGEFADGAKCVTELTSYNSPIKNQFIESVLLEFGSPTQSDPISPAVKTFTWEFCSRLSNKTAYRNNTISALLSTSTTPFIKLSTNEEQLYFITCFAYFYLGMYTTKGQYHQIIDDLRKWIYSTPTEQDLKIMSTNFYRHNINRLCSHPFVLVHLLEIFKKTKTNLTLRHYTLKTLLGAISEKRTGNELDFEKFITRLVHKTVITTLPSPYFLIEH